MTIEYKDSKRIVGLSSDVLNTPTFEDDFSSSTGWTTVGSGLSITGGELDANFTGSSDNRIYKDLGFNLENKFISHFDYYQGTVSSGYWGMFSFTSGTSKPFTSSQDQIGAIINLSGYNVLARSYDGSSENTSQSGTISLSANTQYYVTAIRDGTSFEIKVYSDSARTTQVGSTISQTLSTNVSLSLRYFQTGHYIGGSGTPIYQIDNLKIYNGVSSLTNKPTDVQDNSLFVEKDTARRYWFDSGNLTFEDDFSGTDNWTDWGSGSPISVSTTNDRLDFDVVGNDQANDIGSQYDLTSVSDTAFVLDFDYTTTNIDLRSSGSAVWIYLGLSSLDNNGTNKDQTAQDYVGIYSQISNANDGQKAIAVNNAVIPEGDGDVFDLADGDTWYMRYVRDGNSMDITWYSDSARTNVQATKTLDVTDISDLRYFVVRNRSSAITTPDARITGYIDNVKFYNGVTTPTPATWNQELPVTEGLKLWLDANDATTITESTGAIDQWNDKSGQGNHVSSLTTKRPTYVASSMNGKAVVKFDGVGDYLQRTTFTAGAITGEATTFIVFKSPTDGGGANGTYIMDGGGSSNRTYFVARTNTQNDWQYSGGTGGTLDFGVDHICTILWKNATSSYLRIDGVDVITGTAVAATWNGITLADHYTLADPSSTDDLDEEIAEVLVYDTELSTGDRDSVETYLANKWGISL